MLPFNKNLWTSSYVLWTDGWAMLALLACHVAIDLRGWLALAAHAGSALMLYALVAAGWWEPIYRVGFASWMTPRFGAYLPSLAFAVAFVAFWWLTVWWMDRKRAYVRI